jgi:hypothetical protein
VTSPVTRAETIERLAAAVYPSFAMLAGMELDVFTTLKGRTADGSTGRRHAGVDPIRLNALLYALVAAGLLTVDGESFNNTPRDIPFPSWPRRSAVRDVRPARWGGRLPRCGDHHGSPPLRRIGVPKGLTRRPKPAWQREGWLSPGAESRGRGWRSVVTSRTTQRDGSGSTRTVGSVLRERGRRSASGGRARGGQTGASAPGQAGLEASEVGAQGDLADRGGDARVRGRRPDRLVPDSGGWGLGLSIVTRRDDVAGVPGASAGTARSAHCYMSTRERRCSVFSWRSAAQERCVCRRSCVTSGRQPTRRSRTDNVKPSPSAVGQRRRTQPLPTTARGTGKRS